MLILVSLGYHDWDCHVGVINIIVVLPPCKRGLFPGNVRLHLFCQTKGKMIYAGLNELLADFLEYCCVQLPFGRVLDVADSQFTSTFTELGRYSALVMINLDI